MEIKITIPKKIISTNKLLCRRCACRLGNEKDSWEKELRAVLKEKIKFDKKVSIGIYSYRSKVIDKDNSFLSIKAIVDILKEDRLGFIKDDSPTYIEGPYYFQFVVRDKTRQRTEIVIKEIGA